jgi:hypothetical protein
MKEFLLKMGFQDCDDNVFELENRDCAYDDLKESYGYNDVEDRFNSYFAPISQRVKDKALELKANIDIDKSVEYGLLIIEVL